MSMAKPKIFLTNPIDQIGYDILKDLEFPWPVAQAMLQHHERLDGSGYPRGLSAEQLLPGAKVLMVADVVEAMASHRQYRAALGVDAALQSSIDHGAGALLFLLGISRDHHGGGRQAGQQRSGSRGA